MKNTQNQTELDALQLEIKDSQDTLTGKYLTFWTDGQLFAVPVADVVQIVQMQPITEIPEFPSYAKGIINLRGSVIPIIDVRLRFGKSETEYNDHTCIIITNIGEKLIGFIVDAVEEVTTIDDEDISEPPQMSRDLTNAFLTGVGRRADKMILLLDTQKILSEDVVAQMTAD